MQAIMIQSPSKAVKSSKMPVCNHIGNNEQIKRMTTMTNQKEDLVTERGNEDSFTMISIEKENKRKKEKLNQMKNRIKTNKLKEELYYKQMKRMNSKEERDEDIKEYKKEIKEKIKEKQIEQGKNAENKKRNVNEMKRRQDFEIRSYQITREAKSQSFVSRNKTEKKTMNEMLIKTKALIMNINEAKHCKIKHDFINFQSIKQKNQEKKKKEKEEKTLNRMNALLMENIDIQNQIEDYGKIEDEFCNGNNSIS